MNVEKILDVCYKMFLNGKEQHRLEIIANTFYHGNTCAAVAEIFQDGIMIAESVKDMLEDDEHTKDVLINRCQTQIENVHKRWKGKKDASNSE